jgi:hypothetical protein
MPPRKRQTDQGWTDDYDSTQFHREPWPCPAGWVLHIVEEGAMWDHCPGIGEGMGHIDDVRDTFDWDEDDEFNDAQRDARDIRA